MPEQAETVTNGPVRTILAMWCWRALYFLGVSPGWLHRRYYRREP